MSILMITQLLVLNFQNWDLKFM